jgi:hypothetical protein
MGNVVFGIPNLIYAAFGIAGRYSLNNGVLSKISPSFPNTIEVLDEQAVQTASLLGTPIYEQVTFLLDGTAEGKKYIVPNWPLVDVSQGKIIVKTPINGNNGTVKEYISLDDHQVTIRGVITNDDANAMPLDQIGQMRNVFKINKSIRVISPLFEKLEIDQLVIEDIQFPALEGFLNVQPFVIKALSDKPIELVIKETKKLPGA